MMRLRSGFVLLWLSLVCVQPSRAIAQDYAYDFLNLNKSASISSLGGNGVAFSNHLDAFFQNPAVLSPETHQRVVVGFQKHLMDINSGMAAYGHHMKNIGDFALGLHYINYGQFDETNSIGQVTGTFSAQDLSMQLGYAFDVDTYDYGYLRGGVALKFIYSGIENYSSTAYAFDIGAMMHFYNEQLKIGISVLNWGSQLSSYTSISEDLPLDIRFAVTNQLEGLPLSLTVGLVQLNEDAGSLVKKLQNFTIGAQWNMSEAFNLRAGLNNYLRRNVKAENSAGLSGFSLGIGIAFNTITFDYGMTSWGTIGLLHQLTLATEL